MTELSIFAFPNEDASGVELAARERPAPCNDVREHVVQLDVTCEADAIEQAQRDPRAFALIYRAHYEAIAGYVFRRLGDGHAAEDVVADVFLTAMRCLPRYRYRGVPLRAWLYRIATRACNQWLRRRRRRRWVTLDAGMERGDANAVAPSVERADVSAARQAMLALTLKNQTVLALHYLEGLNVEAVAAATGWRVGTVKSRLSRAREALRERLTRGR